MESNGLTQRLVEAAWSEMKGPPYTNWSYAELPTRAKARVDKTVVAMLRVLAESGQVAWADSLAALAESVERGE